MDRKTQFVEEKDAATQTGAKKTAEEDILQVELEVIPKNLLTKYCASIAVQQVATLANKFLHASYWFLVLGVTFSSKKLEGLASVARRREESSLESAKSLLGTLHKPSLADILKPDWDPRESTERAVRILELLDEWLEEGVKEVQTKVGGSPDHLACLLSRIGSTVRDFHWDSRAWRSRLSED